MAPVPEPVAPVPEPVAPVPEPMAPVPEAAAPVPEAVAPVPEAVAPSAGSATAVAPGPGLPRSPHAATASRVIIGAARRRLTLHR